MILMKARYLDMYTIIFSDVIVIQSDGCILHVTEIICMLNTQIHPMDLTSRMQSENSIRKSRVLHVPAHNHKVHSAHACPHILAVGHKWVYAIKYVSMFAVAAAANMPANPDMQNRE